MKLILRSLAVVSGLFMTSYAFAQNDLLMNCEFKAIVPAGADFFSNGFRIYPVVGTAVQIDFNKEYITSMTFADGGVFFKEHDGTLAKLYGRPGGGAHAGVRVGSQGIYVVQLDSPTSSAATPAVFTSRLSVTVGQRNAAGHLETTETHYGDLECHPVTQK